MEFQIGDIVGDYEIVGLLGRGGMGQVYKTRNRISDRLEALKVVLPERQSDPQIEARFEREIKVHASLSHPNIAALHTALWVDNRLLMLIELVEGISLADRLRQGAMGIREGVDCARQVLMALGYAHTRGVTHRDVKPANILITPAGVVKLTDFGIARSASEAVITRSGLAVGSLFYMSPEQIRGATVDGRSDIYSLGVTLYEALTGRRPIQGPSDYAIMNAHLDAQPISPADFMQGFPAALAEALLKSLAKKPEDRYQTAADFQAALEAAGNISSSATATPPTMAGNFDPAMLGRIDRCLAQALGPVARALVNRGARRAASIPDLCQALAEQIPTEAERRAFLKCCETQTGEMTTGRTTQSPAPSHTKATTQLLMKREWPPEVLEKARKELAHHIGPLAKIIVDKASRKAQTPAEFVELLGKEIADAAEREKFSSMLRKALG
ncbi:MAG: serine/threonine-protein kinase [Bryobacteraceae bacterium]